MRSFLAAALVVAAALPATAHADSASSCLDPLFSSSMPQLVYYNPEIGGYYVDVAAAQAWASAQPARAGQTARCLADAVPDTNGCVTQFVTSPSPNTHVVTIDDQQRVTVDPHGADAFVLATAGAATALVLCVV
jgi:hypothetical protein